MERLHRGPLLELIATIVSGEFAPGDALPREVDLAARFDVSRATSREFLRGLEERGLIAVKHGRGARVNPSSRWDTLDADVLASLLAGPRALKLLTDFLETRRIFEVEAAGLAAERADARDVGILSDAFSRMQAAAQGRAANAAQEQAFYAAEVAFHRRLVEVTRNETLIAVSRRIHLAMLEVRHPFGMARFFSSHMLPQHERIMRAIAKGSTLGARRAMKAHLDSVGELLRAHSGVPVGARDGSPQCGPDG